MPTWKYFVETSYNFYIETSIFMHCTICCYLHMNTGVLDGCLLNTRLVHHYTPYLLLYDHTILKNCLFKNITYTLFNWFRFNRYFKIPPNVYRYKFMKVNRG